MIKEKHLPFFYASFETTSMSGSNFCFNNVSIPPLRVLVAEGHPLQAPFKFTVTVFPTNDSNVIAPPSDSTAGLMY
jgi:hypothetical protein